MKNIFIFLKNFKLQFILFIIFTFFLLIEGFVYYFSYKLYNLCNEDFTLALECKNLLFTKNRTGFNSLIWDENGIVENIQVFLLFVTLFVLFKIIKKSKEYNLDKFFIYFLSIYFLLILYFFLEEISWGQHIFDWRTNKFFITYNNQHETNIHNISGLFDQLPRNGLILWCGFSFLYIKLVNKLSLNNFYLKFILPSNQLKYISMFLILFFLPDFIFDKLNLLDQGMNHYHAVVLPNNLIMINLTEKYEFLSFNFIRLSEYQELIFTFYLFNHASFFYKYLDHKS